MTTLVLYMIMLVIVISELSLSYTFLVVLQYIRLLLMHINLLLVLRIHSFPYECLISHSSITAIYIWLWVGCVLVVGFWCSHGICLVLIVFWVLAIWWGIIVVVVTLVWAVWVIAVCLLLLICIAVIISICGICTIACNIGIAVLELLIFPLFQ